MAEGDLSLKTELFAQFARVGKALASAPRLELLELLIQAPRTVDALAKAAGLSMANTSQHLKVLRQAGLVTAHKQGQFVTVRVAGGSVEALFALLRSVATEQLAEAERAKQAYLRVPETMERIDAETLQARLRDATVTLIDVRPPEEFAAAHLPGALSMPLPSLPDRMASLPTGKPVVAYCRGPYCVYAVKAVAALSQEGYSASLYEDGVGGWRAAALPLARGEA